MEGKGGRMEVEMKIRGLMMDPVTNMPIVVLKDLNGNTILPIWVGIYEANAIALEIEKVSTPRPMTHDLIKTLLLGLGTGIRKVVVSELLLARRRFSAQLEALDSLDSARRLRGSPSRIAEVGAHQPGITHSMSAESIRSQSAPPKEAHMVCGQAVQTLASQGLSMHFGGGAVHPGKTPSGPQL